MSYLKSANGSNSSKRLMGCLYLIIAAIMAVLDQLTDRKVTFDVWLSMAVIGSALLGLGLAEYFAELKLRNPSSPNQHKQP